MKFVLCCALITVLAGQTVRELVAVPAKSVTALADSVEPGTATLQETRIPAASNGVRIVLDRSKLSAKDIVSLSWEAKYLIPLVYGSDPSTLGWHSLGGASFETSEYAAANQPDHSGRVISGSIYRIPQDIPRGASGMRVSVTNNGKSVLPVGVSLEFF